MNIPLHEKPCSGYDCERLFRWCMMPYLYCTFGSKTLHNNIMSTVSVRPLGKIIVELPVQVIIELERNILKTC
jgi:hypothetical protein